MKYVPKEFPIRYALVAHSQVKDGNKHHEEVLYRQLTSWLMKNPITVKTLRLDYGFYNLRQYGQPVSSIASLGADRTWWNRAEKYYKDLLPDLSGSNYGYNTGFAFSLYSYEAGGERPWFLRTYKSLEQAQKKRNTVGSGTVVAKSVHKESMNIWLKTYNDLMEGRITEPEFWERKRVEPDPVYINVPYSYVWEAIENNWKENEGILPPPSPQDIHYMLEGNELPEKKVEDKTINVVVCRNLRSLYYEEFYRIYKNARYCGNCEKPLPDGYQGSYCERPECQKDRDAKRQRKNRALKQRQARKK